ncbi:MAG: zinc dependent phospholipase C family protein [Candidatus Promineifilaceae bacterium]|jgi:hypothetical protein
MPTPFMHLQLSDALHALASQQQDMDAGLQIALAEYWSAFYLGSVAPDYQTICGIPRIETHFYKNPPESEDVAQRNMLAMYPQLYPGQSLDPQQAMFVAAYLGHLQIDLIWHFDVVLPYFMNNSDLEDHHQAYLVHLTLLTYLDNLAFQALPNKAVDVLSAADYDHWLPFVEVEQMNAWRDFLVEQMAPGRTTQTVQIFAHRLRMTTDEFNAKLGDPDWMNEELFSHIPVAAIQQRLQESVPESLAFIEAYWHGRLEL